MSENARLNVWERNNIPVIEYCNLPRAAELLNCQVIDLIHFAEIGAIEFCLELNKFEAALMMMAKDGDFSDWENKFPPRVLNYHNKSALSQFIPVPESNFDLKNFLTEKYEPPKQLYHWDHRVDMKSPLLFLSGIWCIAVIRQVSSFFIDLKTYGEAEIFDRDIAFKEADIPFNHAEFGSDKWIIFAMPPFSKEDFLKNPTELFPNKVIGKIKVNDIYLTRYQMEKIDNGIGKELPSYMNGGVTSPGPLQSVHGNVEASATKREAVYKAAIYWLLKDPESCNGKRGKLTIDAWADKIVAERNNPKTKVELGKDKIKECLSSSKAGRF